MCIEESWHGRRLFPMFSSSQNTINSSTIPSEPFLFLDFSISYNISYIIILLLWQNWLYTTWFLPNKCHLSVIISASHLSLVFTTCSTSYQLSAVKTDKSLLQAWDLPTQFPQSHISLLAKEVKVQRNLTENTTQIISHFTYISY